jgi:LGFP repeat/Lectin C-type domain
MTPGQCGCGNPDTDTDSDGAADCNDGCDNDATKAAPGQCGCGNPDTDGDNDGTANCVDGCPADPAKAVPGQCGCGNSDLDSDTDGAADCTDACDDDPARTVPDCAPQANCTRAVSGGSAYWFCPGHQNWSAARDRCAAAGYSLVRIDSASENIFLSDNVSTDTWVGGTDGAQEGSWRWVLGDEQFWQGASTGSSTGGLYRNWISSQPNDLGGEDCLQIEGDGDWRDDSCADTEQYICEDTCPNDVHKGVPGICGCGVADINTDGDLAADCQESCDQDPNKQQPGICGCGVADTDSNGDGSADCQATAGHNLTGPVSDKWRSMGWEQSILGSPTTDTLQSSDGVGSYANFQFGSIFWSPSTGAHEVHGAVRLKWISLGRELGFLGYPTSDQVATADGSGAFSDFEGGSIYWSPTTGPRELHGAILAKWRSLGAHASVLGYPTSDELVAADGVGRYQKFVSGAIYWTPATGAHEIHGPIFDKWASLGWEQGALGYPTSDVEAFGVDGLVAHFQGGELYWSPCSGVTEDPPDCSSGGGLGACATDADCSGGFTCMNPWFNATGVCTGALETFPGDPTGRIEYYIGDQHNACTTNSVINEVEALSEFPWTQVNYGPREEEALPPDGSIFPDLAITVDHVQGLGRISGVGTGGANNWIAGTISNLEGSCNGRAIASKPKCFRSLEGRS